MHKNMKKVAFYIFFGEFCGVNRNIFEKSKHQQLWQTDIY